MKTLSPSPIDTSKKSITSSNSIQNVGSTATQQYPSSISSNNNNNNLINSGNDIDNKDTTTTTNTSTATATTTSAENFHVNSGTTSSSDSDSSSGCDYNHIIDIPLQQQPPPPPSPLVPAYELQRSEAADVHGHLRTKSNNNNSNQQRTGGNHWRMSANHPSHNSDNNSHGTMTSARQQQQQSSYPTQYHSTTDNESSAPSNVDSESYLELHEAAQMQNNPQLYYHQRQLQQQQQQHHLHNADDTSTILTANYVNYDTNRGVGVVGGNGDHQASSSSSSFDATDVVHEMHLALLYLLSNPEEFQNALSMMIPSPDGIPGTFQQWNAEYDNESIITAETDYFHQQQQPTKGNNNPNSKVPTSATKTPANMTNHPSSSTDNNNNYDTTPPLPFVVFADDAEVVLPQAHTASQLFGIERLDGIELEAAAGIPSLCQLFLRWLALMPGGDHLNIIDPPGLTVMRIAGGRYRVTAAHRVVWTWMNEFVQLTFNDTSATMTPTFSQSIESSHSSSSPPLRDNSDNNNDLYSSSTIKGKGGDSVDQLQIGDLVTMTIVDVFETDNNGKLLSYCPTFDNRAITKTNITSETLRKSSKNVIAAIQRMRKSKLARTVAQQASALAITLKNKVDKAVYGNKISHLPFPNTTFQIPNLSDGHHEQYNYITEPQYDDELKKDDQQSHGDTANPQQQQQPSTEGVLSFETNSTATKTMMTSTTTSTNATTPQEQAKASKPTPSTKNMNRNGHHQGVSLSSSYYLADDDLERHEI